MLPKLLDLASHKKALTRTESEAAARDLIEALPGDALRVIKGALFGAMDREKSWQTRTFALNTLASYATSSPTSLASAMDSA